MITDVFLQELAKNINGESNTNASHLAYSSTAITPDATDTTLTGEFLTRVSATGSRVLTETTFNAIRSGAVASSSGDRINAMALFTSSSGGNLFAEALVPSILHTTAFDFEVDWKITISRA